MGARVAVPEKDGVKGVISPDTDLKKNRRIALKRELSCGLRLLERGKKNRGGSVKEFSQNGLQALA